jgi:hypothetical protein
LNKRKSGAIGLPNWWYALKRGAGEVKTLFRSIYRRIRYHWFTSNRVLTIRSIKANEYRDIDTLLFEAVMQLLVNFVENEKAHMTRICSVRHYEDYMKGEVKWDELDEFTRSSCIIDYIKASRFDKWWNEKKWDEILGQNYLEWEVSLKDTSVQYDAEHTANLSQSESAAEILRIYRWYKFERPNRVDPWESDFDKPHYAYEHEDGSLTNEMLAPTPDEQGMFSMRKITPEYAEYLKKCSDLEDEQNKEDTRNAMRIVEIRRHLWT